jgi:RimJ/RimL family protein N-acetyltransferase
MPTVLETERLVLRRLGEDDAAFMLALLNEPSFWQNIGDRGVRTLEQARQYIVDGPVASYAKHGFGLYLVELKADGTPIGICGLVKRDHLDAPDIGFAFRPQYWSFGYACESAAAVLDYARRDLGVGRIVAITAPDNTGSIKVLTKIGLVFGGLIEPPAATPEAGKPCALYVPGAGAGA